MYGKVLFETFDKICLVKYVQCSLYLVFQRKSFKHRVYLGIVYIVSDIYEKIILFVAPLSAKQDFSRFFPAGAGPWVDPLPQVCCGSGQGYLAFGLSSAYRPHSRGAGAARPEMSSAYGFRHPSNLRWTNRGVFCVFGTWSESFVKPRATRDIWDKWLWQAVSTKTFPQFFLSSI